MPIPGIEASAGMKPTTPTIGTATDGGTGTTVSVAFTPSTYIGKGTITYTATSSPGSLTGTGSGSPITVSGLTTGTAYTFTVAGATNYGVNSDASAASNSVTPVAPTSFDSIATATPGGSNTTTFSSIPSTYKTLQLRIFAPTTSAINGTIVLQFNGDTGSNYSRHIITGNGSTVGTSGVDATATQATVFGYLFGTNTTGGSACIVDIIDYASTSKIKVVKSLGGGNNNTTNQGEIGLYSSMWNNSSAINSVTVKLLSANFGTGTSVGLYGIKG